MVASYTCLFQSLQLLFRQQTHGSTKVYLHLLFDLHGILAQLVDILVRQGASTRDKRELVHPVFGVQPRQLHATLLVN